LNRSVYFLLFNVSKDLKSFARAQNLILFNLIYDSMGYMELEKWCVETRLRSNWKYIFKCEHVRRNKQKINLSCIQNTNFNGCCNHKIHVDIIRGLFSACYCFVYNSSTVCMILYVFISRGKQYYSSNLCVCWNFHVHINNYVKVSGKLIIQWQKAK